MSIIFVFLLMIFCHILDDFGLQKGLLCFMKQKKWWESQEDFKPLYKFDYIWGLLVHSFSWAFMVMLPIAIYQNFSVGWRYAAFIILHWLTHAYVDNLKANKGEINLWLDQLLHMAQIIIIFVFWNITGFNF